MNDETVSLTISLTGNGQIATALVGKTGDLPQETEQKMLDLIYQFGTIAVMTELFNGEPYHTISQAQNTADLEWSCEALNRLEDGWTLENNKLYSPLPSHAPDKSIADILINSGLYHQEEEPPAAVEQEPITPRPGWRAIFTGLIGFVLGLSTCVIWG